MLKKIKKLYPWIAVMSVALAVFLAIYGATTVLAKNSDNVSSVVMERQEASLIKQEIKQLWTDDLILTSGYFESLRENLPDVSTGAARLLILSTVMTLWLSTKYFTRLLS